ncbi:hypothetical protein DFH06DRAFT_673142 [Mycena polygramma]|nr:hypothetical protein DFH06DRAFT_673142 [Mycena polygramma]
MDSSNDSSNIIPDTGPGGLVKNDRFVLHNDDVFELFRYVAVGCQLPVDSDQWLAMHNLSMNLSWPWIAFGSALDPVFQVYAVIKQHCESFHTGTFSKILLLNQGLLEYAKLSSDLLPIVFRNIRTIISRNHSSDTIAAELKTTVSNTINSVLIPRLNELKLLSAEIAQGMGAFDTVCRHDEPTLKAQLPVLTAFIDEMKSYHYDESIIESHLAGISRMVEDVNFVDERVIAAVRAAEELQGALGALSSQLGKLEEYMNRDVPNANILMLHAVEASVAHKWLDAKEKVDYWANSLQIYTD